jgi:hypothetical protein
MIRLLLLTVFLLGEVLYGQAQPVSCSPEGRRVFERLMRDLPAHKGLPVGEATVLAGKALLGTPYRANTLEVSGEEPLVVNFSGLDCTTFVENALVLGRMMVLGQADWEAYLRALEEVRYRGGERAGYPSRLHYFSEWIHDNARKGLVSDITPELGGVLVSKAIDFMGTHRERYPLLAQEDIYGEILQMERGLRGVPLYVLPRDEVAARETKLRDGDIIALATDIPGLDVTHTGIALRLADGRIHLLHASTQGQVMITEEPLADYLEKVSRNTGIMVARPLQPFP